MAKIAVIGKTGQVARALLELLPDSKFYGREEIDLADPDFGIIGKPDIIINAAAYTAVDKAESEPELADKVNHLAVAALAEYCAAHNITLVHYSTDYVFDGSGTEPFTEDNTQNLSPLNVYGRTKLAGELAIITSGCKYYILRTSWVYSHEGNNFVKTMLRLSGERSELKIVADQVGSPTSAADIAENTLTLLEKNPPYGIYHFVPDKQLNWYEFAKLILSGKNINLLPITSAEYPVPAKRPLNSRLANSKIKNIGMKFPDFEVSLNRTLCRIK